MDDILVLAAAVVISIPVTLIYLLIAHSRLKKRVGTLESQLKDQRRAPAPAPQTIPTAQPAAVNPPKDVGKASQTAAAPEKPEPAQPKPQQAAAVAAGPSIKTTAQAGTARAAGGPPKAVVMHSDNFSRLGNWLAKNWFYAVAAASLALAGLFLVQYGMEHGFLPPIARVLAALAFGLALIGAGEYIRRRFGDGEGDSTAYLPETFSGAGIVALFGAIVSARLLYDLIGPEVAFAGLFATALLAIVLGWFNGPILAAIGVIGGMVAPFIVGGSSDSIDWLYGYFIAIVILGLAIDTVRRWAWVSVVTLVLAYAVGSLLAMTSPGGSEIPFALYLTAIAILTIAIPVRSLWPNHDGPMILALAIEKKFSGWPEFPARLSLGALAATSAILMLQAIGGTTAFWAAISALTLLTVAMILWARKAAALQDQTLIPAVGLLLTAGLYAPSSVALALDLSHVTWLIGAGLVISALAAWRSQQETTTRVFWAAGAVLFAPILAIALELSWNPAAKIGAYPWALHAMAIAALMVFLAERFARSDGPEDRLRFALATISALSSIAFASVIVLSSAALTLALAATVAAAAWLDRRFDLRPMSYFIMAGVVAVGYRLIADPGIFWAQDAPILEMIAAYGGALAVSVGSLKMLEPRDRENPKIMLDSAAWSIGGAFLSLLLYRAIVAASGQSLVDSHWALSLTGVVWIGVALAQMQRLPIGGRLRLVRLALASLFAVLAAIALIGSVIFANPLITSREVVLGPVIFNTLMVAYLLPALVLLAGALRIKTLEPLVRMSLLSIAAALSALWLALTIRHFWQGASGMSSGTVTQPELYSYTVALLVIGAALFYQAIARSSSQLRRAGLAVIALAVAKVFFIDISGLGGLTRVFSFLVLGLLLAALAWLDRWGQLQNGDRPDEAKGAPASQPLDG